MTEERERILHMTVLREDFGSYSVPVLSFFAAFFLSFILGFFFFFQCSLCTLWVKQVVTGKKIN